MALWEAAAKEVLNRSAKRLRRTRVEQETAKTRGAGDAQDVLKHVAEIDASREEGLCRKLRAAALCWGRPIRGDGNLIGDRASGRRAYVRATGLDVTTQ